MRIITRMNVGGPAVQITGLMRGLNSDNFEQRLYTGFCKSNEADYLETVATDLKVTRIDGLGRRINFGGDVKALIQLLREIRSFKPDIIHTHTTKAGFLGRAASVISLQPSIRVHTFHGHLLNGYFGSFKRTILIILERVFSLITNQLLAVGEKVRQDLLLVGIGHSEKFGLMPPGISISELPNQKASREDFGLPKGVLQCIFIGRITQIKRPDRFLDVVTEIKKRGIALNFTIVGDGELLAECRKRIILEDLPVNVLGWQSDIEKVLSIADIVLLTSDNEGTPISLIQAGMSGLPVVTTGVGSVPEIVLDGFTGIITSLDFQEIADALEELVNNPDLRTAMGKAAHDYTLANFSVERLVRDHEHLYKNLISNRAKS